MDDNKITYFAETDSRNKRVKFGIKQGDRSRHSYFIGKTGMGKSTVLENMAIQDIRDGNGFAFLDPHGKTADLFLEYVPEERIKDVIYFAPFDTDYPISFNVMEDVGPDKRHLVANGLMSAFKKIWVDAWSARMEYILNNILLALLEYPGSTLIGVNRMLADKEYRSKVVENITDPSVKAFWTDEYAKYTERFAAEAAPAIQNKIGQFISNPLVRNIIGQPKSSFDFRKAMDERKIIIINLSKGRMGEANANLLGSMIITKIYLAAMSRADSSEDQMKALPNFYLYVDEFQNFANESFADILSEARKYKLALTVAHQYIEQMAEEVRAAVFGNVGTMVTFRVGAYDAEVLEKEFAPQFTAEDLVNLGRFQAYMKLMIDGVSSPPFSATTMAPLEKPIVCFKNEIVEMSRQNYARPRAAVEDEIRIWHEKQNVAAGGGQQGNQGQRQGQPKNADSKNTERPSQPSSPQAQPRPERKPEASQGSQNQNQNQSQVKSSSTNVPRQTSNDEEKSSDKPQQQTSLQPQQPAQQLPQRNAAEEANKRETDLRKAMSLDFLKTPPQEERRQKDNNTAKVPTKENIQGLREALLSVMKDVNLVPGPAKSEAKPQPQQDEKKTVHAHQSQQHQHQHHPEKKEQAPKSPQSQSPASPQQIHREQPREIPEEILKQLLQVEDEQEQLKA
jgi:hypothetical protein